MRASGFVQHTWKRHDELQKNYFYASSQPSLIRIDDWQVAFVNIKRIVPDVELFIRPELVLTLKERVMKAASISGEKYIVDAYVPSM